MSELEQNRYTCKERKLTIKHQKRPHAIKENSDCKQKEIKLNIHSISGMGREIHGWNRERRPPKEIRRDWYKPKVLWLEREKNHKEKSLPTKRET